MRAVPYAYAAVFAYNRQGVFSVEIDGLDNAGVRAFPAFNAFFLIVDNAPALPVRQRAGRAGNGAGPFIPAAQAVDCEEVAGKAAHRPDFDCAFGIRITFMVYSGAYTLACKTPDAFVHVIRF